MRYKVSVVVPTYNPDYKKLKITLMSIILQQNVDVQVVVSDDASETFDSEEIKNFFYSNHFKHFYIVKNESNVGTVNNILNALQYCKYDLIRDVGQSDVFRDQLSLFRICEFQEKNNADVVLSNAINFNYKKDGIIIQKTLRMPQNVKSFNSKLLLERYYVWYSDIGNGATTLYKKSILKKYLLEVSGIIKYSEDQILKFMILDKMKVCYFDCNTMFYEYGEGVSKSGSKLREQDSKNIIKLFKKHINSLQRKLNFFSLYNKSRYFEHKTIMRKILWLLTSPGLVLFTLRCKLWPVYLPESYLNQFFLKCVYLSKGDQLCK